MRDNLENIFFLFFAVVLAYYLERTWEVTRGSISYVLVLPSCCFHTLKDIRCWRLQSFSRQSITGLHNLTMMKAVFFPLGV